MSIHIFSSLQYDLGGVEHTFHSPFRCFDVKSHEHAPCTNIHCTCILAPAVGSMPASFPARPRTTGGSVAFLCFFFCLLPYPQGQQIIIQVTPARERSTPRETREALHAVEEEPCYEGHNNKQMELKTVAISPQ